MAAKKSADLTVVESVPQQAVTTQESNVFSAIERIMTDPNASVERANQAFEFYQKVEADKARKAFDAAMADAKAEIPPILKNRLVSHKTKDGGTKSYRHEDLAEIARTVDPILSKFGLSYRFRTTSAPNEPIVVTCIVSHRLGYFEENSLSGGRDDSGNKNSMQAMGSAITYMQRYTLKAALGLSVSNDDDGKDSGAPLLITEEQADTLLTLIRDTKSDPQQFLEIAGVEMINDIPAANFKVVEGLLLAKKRKQGAPV
jgi:hypothetical protein